MVHLKVVVILESVSWDCIPTPPISHPPVGCPLPVMQHFRLRLPKISSDGVISLGAALSLWRLMCNLSAIFILHFLGALSSEHSPNAADAHTAPCSYSICSIWFCQVQYIFSQARMQKISTSQQRACKFLCFRCKRAGEKKGKHCRQLWKLWGFWDLRVWGPGMGTSEERRYKQKSGWKYKILCLSIASCSKETWLCSLTFKFDSSSDTSS